MKAVAAALGIAWAAFNVLVSFFMVSSFLTAKTVIKEGIPAQAALLLGGVAIEALAVVLMWQCVRMLRGK